MNERNCNHSLFLQGKKTLVNTGKNKLYLNLTEDNSPYYVAILKQNVYFLFQTVILFTSPLLNLLAMFIIIRNVFPFSSYQVRLMTMFIVEVLERKDIFKKPTDL